MNGYEYKTGVRLWLLFLILVAVLLSLDIDIIRLSSEFIATVSSFVK